MSEMVERVAMAILKGQEKEAFPNNLDLARAAIEAMRTWDNDMIVAGHEALMNWDARTGDDKGIHEVWEAMIDRALK